MSNINNREIALDTSIEILEHGQFSHIYLNAVLGKFAYLEKSERAFITRIVNGILERKIELDYIIDHYSKIKTKKMKPLIRTILRMGTFEIYYMDAVPNSATCNEYVKLAKKRSFVGLSGFVNGVLRNIARDKGGIQITDISIKYSMPQWIVDKWITDYGKDTCDKILSGFFEQQDLCIRVNTAKISVDELINELEADGIRVRKCESLASALYISDFDSLSTIKSFGEGKFYVQDYSSQLVADLAGVSRFDTIIDVCAAPGGKALHFAQLAQEGTVLARDITEAKVALIQENLERIGAANVTAQLWDATQLDADSIGKYDIVIADLPCSGFGVIRKKPDIKYNQSEESLSELVQLQRQILDTVHAYVKPGGTLCYSTCTINIDENQNQIEAFLLRHPEFEIAEQRQLFPDSGHDGFYICVMKKNK